MKKFYSLLAGIMVLGTAHAQLDTVTRFNQVIQDLQTFDNKLFIGGNFTENEGSTCYWSAYYDGNNITRHTTLIGGIGIRNFAVFDNELYNVGAMDFGFSTGVGLWNGTGWTDGGSTNYSHSTIYSDISFLYVESDDGVIRSKVAGGNFLPFYDFAGTGGLQSIQRYGNMVIFAGSFAAIGGVSANNIAQWDGGGWLPMGDGLNNNAGSMALYNGELYVAGSFTLAGTTVVDGIAKWDGTNWTDVGGGLAGSSGSSGINDMIVFNGLLYVSGRFDMIGGQTADDFAYWDGSSWTGINLPHPELSLRSMTIYDGELYLGGWDFNTSRLYRYLGGVGVPDYHDQLKLSVFPNPSDGLYTIQLDNNDPEFEYVVFNSVGQEVQTGNTARVDLSNQEAGLYYLRVVSGKSTATEKLIKH